MKSWTPTHYFTPPPFLSLLKPISPFISCNQIQNQTKPTFSEYLVSFPKNQVSLSLYLFLSYNTQKEMEGLIPFVYRAIVQYKNGREGHVLATWFNESPSASYMRLPTEDSGRFQISDKQVFRSDYGNFSTSSSSPSSMATSSTTQIILSTGVQSPVCRLTSRHVVK